MKRLAIIIFALFCASLVRAQTVAISGQVRDQYGQPVSGAQVYICDASVSTGTPCSPVANIWQDYNRTISAGNPTQTDANGDFNVFGATLAFPNIYVVNMIPQAGTTYTIMVNGPSPCTASGCVIVGPVTATLFNATQSPYYEINGVQIACSALSDCANLAKLNAANTFTGVPQTAPIWNATTMFEVNGVQIAAANLSNGTTGTGAIVLANTPTLITPNIGAATGTSLNLSGNAIVGGTLQVTSSAQASVFNGLGGFQYNSTAPLNHILVGNGVDYVDSATVPSGALPTFYYQTFQANSVDQNQRSKANFTTNFTLSDSVSPSVTTVDLSNTGVTAGACNNPSSITFDAKGRASICTSAGGTTPVAKTCSGTPGTPPWSCYTVAADGTRHEWGVTNVTFAAASEATQAVLFNAGFTITPAIMPGLDSSPDGASPPNAVTHYIQGASSAGFQANVRCSVNIGGSGCPGSMSSTVTFGYDAWGQ